jgi:hypothetical protein
MMLEWNLAASISAIDFSAISSHFQLRNAFCAVDMHLAG